MFCGRVCHRKASALGGTTILAKLQVSDEGQVKSENLYIHYTQIHVMVIAFHDVRMLNWIRVRSLSRCYKNNPINMASIFDHRLKRLWVVLCWYILDLSLQRITWANLRSVIKGYHMGEFWKMLHLHLYILHYV